MEPAEAADTGSSTETPPRVVPPPQHPPHPLLLAARDGDAAQIAALLQLGAATDAEQVDGFGNSALYYACHYGHAEVAALLVAHGCRDDATRRCWRNALDRGALPFELRQRVPDAATASASAAGAQPAGALRSDRKAQQAAALAAELGVDEVVARAMLYGATRLRHRGNAHKMACSPRRWSGPEEIDAFFAPLFRAEPEPEPEPQPQPQPQSQAEPDTDGDAADGAAGAIAPRALDMRKCVMAGHGAACLSRVLSQPSCSLLDLYLFANALQDGGTAALSDGLRQNTSLTKLNLCGNQIGPVGAAALGAALGAHPSLTQCDLNCNEITNAGVAPLVASIGSALTISPLAVLSLRKNGLTDTGVHALYDAAVANPRLADVAVCADWPPPRRQKRLQASSGLQDSISKPAAARLHEFLQPRRARLKAAKERVDDPEALRKLFAATRTAADN